jgi:DNA-binding MarR family transcriptional regulator
VDSLTEDLEAIATLLPRLVGAQHRRMVDELADYGLTFSQFIALTVLESHVQGCRMGPLAEAAQQSAASMTGIVDRLLERGWVERERHPEDRRAVVVRLSEKGSDILVQVKEARRQQGRALLAALPSEDRRHFRRILTRIVDLMENDGDNA